MASEYKDRYGIPGEDVTRLIRRFYRYFSDSDWHNADHFVRWCSENGWNRGLRLCRNDTSKPHGPGNSYFQTPEMTVRAKKEDIRRRKEERKNTVSPFCEGCQKQCTRVGYGCEEYRAWFVKNWNQNIHVPPVKPVVDEGRKVFRYEHPDLVREGIVFENSQSIPKKNEHVSNG